MEDGLKKVIRLAKTISNPIASSEMSWELKINQLICKKKSNKIIHEKINS